MTDNQTPLQTHIQILETNEQKQSNEHVPIISDDTIDFTMINDKKLNNIQRSNTNANIEFNDINLQDHLRRTNSEKQSKPSFLSYRSFASSEKPEKITRTRAGTVPTFNPGAAAAAATEEYKRSPKINEQIVTPFDISTFRPSFSPRRPSMINLQNNNILPHHPFTLIFYDTHLEQTFRTLLFSNTGTGLIAKTQLFVYITLILLFICTFFIDGYFFNDNTNAYTLKVILRSIGGFLTLLIYLCSILRSLLFKINQLSLAFLLSLAGICW
jgi:hypothetical protein